MGIHGDEGAEETPDPALVALFATAGALALDAAAAQLMTRLGQAGVRALLFKGGVLASWLYDDGTPRPYGDIDIIADAEQEQKVTAVLRDLGYEPRHESKVDIGSPWYASVWNRPGSQIDLHDTVTGPSAPPAEVFAAFWSSRTSASIAGTSVPVPGRPAQLLLACLHVAHHGHDTGKPLEDLRRAVLRGTLDEWSAASDLAASIGAQSAMASGLLLVPEGASLVDSLGLEARFTRTEILRRGGRDNNFALTLERLATIDGTASRLTYLWRRIVPTPDRMRSAYPMANRGTVGLVLSYPTRLIRMLPFAFRGVSSWLAAHRTARGANR